MDERDKRILRGIFKLVIVGLSDSVRFVLLLEFSDVIKTCST